MRKLACVIRCSIAIALLGWCTVPTSATTLDTMAQSSSEGGSIEGSIPPEPPPPNVFSYPVGLDPDGDNWVALRSLPSASEGTRLARLGPDTLFTEVGRAGDWVRVRLLNGEIGWVSARYVACCRTASVTAPGPDRAVAPSPAVSQSCGDLWYQRNAIYKAAGYCFRTGRGISAFGNAGCQYDNMAEVPLSARQRDEVAEIQQQERYQGCPR